VLEELRAEGVDAQVASGGGRMHITMDRYEADWPMVQRGWQAHVLGKAEHSFTDPVTAVTELRKIKPNDQYLPSFVIVDAAGAPVGTVEDGDAVVLFNFRADRVVELSKAFEYTEPGQFTHFDRERVPQGLHFAGLMQYDGDLKLPSNFLVPPPTIDRVSGEWLSKNGLKTFACSETQKFGHVTFFWNGTRSGLFDDALETYVEVPSDNVPFNTTPAMKAPEITAAGIEALRSRRFDVVRINYANPDMVGHTGDLAATIQACEVVDAQVGLLVAEVERLGGVFLVTADHGNADDMVQREKKTNKPVKNADGSLASLTSHTLAPVPVAIGGPGLPPGVVFRTDLPDAGLANITATFIELMGYQAPDCMVPSLLASA
jgi:2,3-bisphosphoglycerate-independent phosphoglycerate mutase